MPFKVPNEGEVEFLKILITDTANWWVKLYQNPRTPTDGDTTANYTEATFTGYNGNQSPTNWTVPAIDGSGMARTTADPLDFDFTGGPPQTIYGYYVINTAGKLLWAEQFMPPVNLTAPGDKITLTPSLTLCSLF